MDCAYGKASVRSPCILLFNSTSTSRLGFKFGFRQSCSSSRGLSAVLRSYLDSHPARGFHNAGHEYRWRAHPLAFLVPTRSNGCFTLSSDELRLCSWVVCAGQFVVHFAIVVAVAAVVRFSAAVGASLRIVVCFSRIIIPREITQVFVITVLRSWGLFLSIILSDGYWISSPAGEEGGGMVADMRFSVGWQCRASGQD